MKQSDFENEIERMHPSSFGWALWCCDHKQDEAEEVLQTTYLKVFDGSARFDGHSTLRTWLFAVIRRTAWEQRRRRWVRQQLFDRWFVLETAPVPVPNPESTASKSESGRVLLNAITRLSTRQREVMHLVFYQDLTVEEAAQVLNISLGSARTHFARGKSQLRRLLAPPENGNHDR